MIEAGGKPKGIRISDTLHKWRGISIEICRLMEYYKNVVFPAGSYLEGMMKRSNVFNDESNVACKVCGKNLLDDVENSLVNIVQNTKTHKIVSVTPCCKGKCDQRMQLQAGINEVSGWKDLKEFTNPYLYLKHIMSVMNSMAQGYGFENAEAFENYKALLIQLYPYIARDMEKDEIEYAALMNAVEF